MAYKLINTKVTKEHEEFLRVTSWPLWLLILDCFGLNGTTGWDARRSIETLAGDLVGRHVGSTSSESEADDPFTGNGMTVALRWCELPLLCGLLG